MMAYDFEKQLDAGKAGEKELDGLWKDARIIDVSEDPAWQKQGIDRVLELPDGKKFSLEYKTDFIAHRTGNLVFETVSVDTSGTPGWGVSSKAEYLVYLLAETKVVYIIHLPALRRWVAERSQNFRKVAANNDSYRTISLLVPLRELERQSFVYKLVRCGGMPNQRCY
jgi:hypothetical protein